MSKEEYYKKMKYEKNSKFDFDSYYNKKVDDNKTILNNEIKFILIKISILILISLVMSAILIPIVYLIKKDFEEVGAFMLSFSSGVVAIALLLVVMGFIAGQNIMRAGLMMSAWTNKRVSTLNVIRDYRNFTNMGNIGQLLIIFGLGNFLVFYYIL